MLRIILNFYLLYVDDKFSVPDPGPFWPLDPGWVKNQDTDPGWTSRIIFPRSDADPGPGILLTLDPGWKNSDTWSGINIPDPQHWVNSPFFYTQMVWGNFLQAHSARYIKFFLFSKATNTTSRVCDYKTFFVLHFGKKYDNGVIFFSSQGPRDLSFQ